MFSWFKSKRPRGTSAAPALPEVLGLRLGGSVELNELRLRLLDDRLITDNIARVQLIQAVGVVRLDESSHLLRFYTDDDAFIQVALSGGLGDEHVTDVKLFHFYVTRGVGSESDWNRLLDSGISSPEYALEGKTFKRVWEAVGANPPVAMTERTHTEGEPVAETDQFIMLYELEAGPGLFEFLLVSGEEKIIDNHPDRCLVLSTGIDLSQADFEIIS